MTQDGKFVDFTMGKLVFSAFALTIVVCVTSIPSARAQDEVRLVLQITVDGLRADLPMRSLGSFGDGGFRYLLDNGTVFANAHYEHANTETIVGHATLATGAQPSVHGMTGNVWRDAATDELAYNIEDSDYLPLPVRDVEIDGDQVDPAQLIARTTGRSPRSLLAESLSDKMRSYSGQKAKVFAVSGKDRSAVAMGGHSGKAFWMSTDSGDFVTTTYYFDAYPEWVASWNAERKAKKFAETQWALLDDVGTYAMAHQDDRPYETDLRGFGRTFPHQFGSADNKLVYTQVIASPRGDALLADFAKTLIANESLGQDDETDYLSVSFSGVDAVNHFFGPASLESEDMIRQLDRTLADFLKFVDQQVGLDKTLIVLSADHGMPEAPEYMQSIGVQAGRLLPQMIIDAANEIGSELLDIDEIVKYYYRPYLYLHEDKIAAKGIELSVAQESVAGELVKETGIYAAVTKAGFHKIANDEVARRVRNNYHPERAGDIYIVQDPYWFNFDPGPVAVMHGSPWRYDTHVPVIFAGPGVPASTVYRQVQPADVAPTLAALLGMSPPGSAQGTVLPEVFEQ
jgi:predicted AlkP superfamily pyrophosphatase or phosphodiesterase